MDTQQLIDVLSENISYGLRHTSYERCLAVRKFAKMISTGEDQGEEVTRYRRFEDEDLKRQRERLYNTLTKSALARPRKYWKRMNRVEGIRRNFKVSGKQEELILTELQNSFYNFMPGEALEQYLTRVLEYYGVTDPNAWILYERNDVRNAEGVQIKTTVYPVVFSCESVLNFQKSYSVLDWVIFRAIRIERDINKGQSQDVVLEDFYLYAPGVIVRMREIGPKTSIEQGESIASIPNYSGASHSINPVDGKQTPIQGDSSKPRNFYLKTITNGTTEVPAECVGVYFDEVTGQQSYVTWFDPAEHVFKDLIHEKSVSDVLLTTYAYPKETVYTKACKHTHPDFGECVGGFYNDIRDAQHTCQSCGGSGRMAGFTTEQARIELILPEGAQQGDLIELSKLSHTQEIDIALLEWIDSKQERTEARILSTIFDSGLVQRPTNTSIKTATEVNSILEGISDVLAPFGSCISRHFELAYRVGGQYKGIKIDVDHSFPDGFKIEALPDIVSGFADIKSAGVGYEAILAQRARVFQKLFEGDPTTQKKILARYKFLPFDDKSENEVSTIISSLAPTDPSRVLRSYWRDIFLEIESEDPLFFEKDYKAQKAIVDAKVEIFSSKIVVDTIEPLPNFNEPV